jgi:hypothetical protein
MEYLPSKTYTPTTQGVAYTYYEGAYKNLPDFPHKGKRIGEGVMKNFIVTDAPSEDYYGYEFEGIISIPQRDVYQFHMICDDGALLYIDGRLVLDFGESHSMNNRTKAKVALDTGYHDIRVVYYEDCMGEGLEISLETLTLPRQAIPDNWLFVKE